MILAFDSDYFSEYFVKEYKEAVPTTIVIVMSSLPQCSAGFPLQGQKVLCQKMMPVRYFPCETQN